VFGGETGVEHIRPLSSCILKGHRFLCCRRRGLGRAFGRLSGDIVSYWGGGIAAGDQKSVAGYRQLPKTILRVPDCLNLLMI